MVLGSLESCLKKDTHILYEIGKISDEYDWKAVPLLARDMLRFTIGYPFYRQRSIITENE
jgi:hypothetical protein